jgi:hypothetical protein
MGAEVGHILWGISEDEHTQGRPLLSAVAVGVNGLAGPGFFSLGQALGELAQDADAKTQRAFWEAQRAAAYETWKRPLRKEA